MKRILFICFSFSILGACNFSNNEFNIKTSEMGSFAFSQIKEAIKETEYDQAKIIFKLDLLALKPQAYSISASTNQIEIKGGDERGLMYGGLEVAEQLKLHQKIRPTKDSPYIVNRGIKLNIPLDSRTPSYDDSGDAANKNIAEMWSWEFWTEYLDKMAINRYNVLSLWNPHPFPSLIKLDEFPEVALDDVCRTTYKPTGYENEMGDPQLVATNVIQNLDTIIEISIDQKIAFWQNVMQYAANRGIDIYWITWNICPNSVANPVEPGYKTFGINMENEAPGKHGITHQIDNPITIAYHRAAVKQFLLTYPLIKGIGVTAGEHMPKKWIGKNREEWLWETYGQGILDVKKEQPNRVIPFIHRVWHSDMEQIMTYWGQYPDPFEVSFKYAKARLYSSPSPKFHLEHIKQMKEYDLKSWWNLRNDDIFVYRWGNTKYVRSFIKNLPYESTKGFMMGSDGYVWGREFISKNEALSGELEFDKHWMKFMLWGRLAYNPDLDESLFIEQTKSHYQASNNQLLYETWQNASKIIPLVNSYHWHNWDANWGVESCSARPVLGGFLDVFDFIDNPTMEGSGMLSPSEFVNQERSNQDKSITPPMVVDSLLKLSQNSLDAIAELTTQDPATQALFDDIQAMAYLGKYFAFKINTAVSLARFKSNRSQKDIGEALKQIRQANRQIKLYADISRKNYKPQMMARTIELDWDIFEKEAINEVRMISRMSFMKNSPM